MKTTFLGFYSLAILSLALGQGLPRALLQENSEEVGEETSQAQIDLDLITSAEKGDVSDAEAALNENAKVTSSDGFGWTALHFAAFANSEKIAKLLIGRGADIEALSVSASRKRNVFTGEKSTPLHVAAAFGATEVAKVLVEAGANIDVKDQRGWTPLLKAARYGHAETVKVLLDAGAKFDDPGNLSALHLAAVAGHLDVCKLLLDKGANVNGKSSSGDTALQYAAEYGYFEIAKILVEKGADKALSNNAQKTPKDLICIKRPGCADQGKLEELLA